LALDFDLSDWFHKELGEDSPGVAEIKKTFYESPREEIQPLLDSHLEDILQAIEDAGFSEPTYVIMSGYGHHVYWWTECGGVDIERMRKANRWLMQSINEIGGSAVADTAAKDIGTRLLRPPGSFNRKGQTPVEVVQVYETERADSSFRVPSVIPSVSFSQATPTRPSNPFAGIGTAQGPQHTSFSTANLKGRWSGQYNTLRELVDAELTDTNRLRLQCPFHTGSCTDSAFLTRNNQGQPYLVCTSSSDGLTYWDSDWIPPRQQAQVVAVLTTTRQGGFRNSLENAVSVLTQDTRWAGRLWYNERSFFEMIDDRQLMDADVINARIWIQKHYGFEPGKNTMFDAFTSVVYQNRINPLTDWLDSLDWDGSARMDTWMENAFDCEESDYYRQVARKFLISAIARAYEPGCKVDTVLMLIGTQGLGKSTLLRTLTGDAWFGDTDLPLSNKDSYIMLARAWIYEIAELTSFKRADADKVKAFITSQVDSFRKPFERKTIDYPRHTCIVASSNNETPLNDPTGSRRFWPVYMHEYADLTWLKANREQLWAEAREAYKAGEVWHLSREMEKEQQRLAEERFTEEDPVKGVLVRWIERPGHETFTLTDIYQKALAGASASSNRITRLLKELGAAPLKQSRENRLRIRYWLKPGSALPEGHEYRDLDTAQRHIRTLNNVIPLAPVSSLD